MKTVALFLSLFLVLSSCASNHVNETQKESSPIDSTTTLTKPIDSLKEEFIEPQKSPEIVPVKKNDSIPSFEVDGYPITNAMFKTANYLEKPVLYFDGLWFSHGNQTLAIALYTDNYRYAIYHFSSDKMPLGMLDEMELNKPQPNGDIADLTLKKELFPQMFPNNNEVDSSYFTSLKGFRLGDSIAKAIEEYGQPDSVAENEDVKTYLWKFIGDTFYQKGQDLKGKPLARNSFGHQVRMYVKDGKLIGISLHNDIP